MDADLWNGVITTEIKLQGLKVSCSINWNDKYGADGWDVCDTGFFVATSGNPEQFQSSYLNIPNLLDTDESRFTVEFDCKVL